MLCHGNRQVALKSGFKREKERGQSSKKETNFSFQIHSLIEIGSILIFCLAWRFTFRDWPLLSYYIRVSSLNKRIISLCPDHAKSTNCTVKELSSFGNRNKTNWKKKKSIFPCYCYCWKKIMNRFITMKNDNSKSTSIHHLIRKKTRQKPAHRNRFPKTDDSMRQNITAN